MKTTTVMVLIFCYSIGHALYVGWSYLPTEADSLYYHLPLAKSFLAGEFVAAEYGDNAHMYFPAASEGLLAIQLALGIPVGYFNVFGILALFGVSYQLGKIYKLEKNEALTFAATVGTLYGVVRWIHAQTVDIWLAVYYLALIVLLQRPKNTWSYFLHIGILVGFLVGSKYSGPLFALGLFVLFAPNFWQFLRKQVTVSGVPWLEAANNWLKIMTGILCATVIGGFWYIRNYLVKGNPFFPLDTIFFNGIEGNAIIATPIWKAYLLYPKQMMDGAVSEFMVWPVVAVGVCGYMCLRWWKSSTPYPAKIVHTVTQKETSLHWQNSAILQLLAVYNFLVFLLLPSGDSMQLHISQYRFAYIVIIPVILSFFIIAKTHDLQRKLVPVLVLSNILTVAPISYTPKVFILAIGIYFLIQIVISQNKANKRKLF